MRKIKQGNAYLFSLDEDYDIDAYSKNSHTAVSGGLKLLSEGRAKPVRLLFSVFFLKI